MNDSAGRTFALVGPGRAGTAISLALVDAGSRAVAVAGRSAAARSTRVLAARLHAPAVSVEEAGMSADLVVIATPDGAIEEAAARLAPGLRAGALVIHLSGARGADALAPLERRRDDVQTGALHPLQTFTGAARTPDEPEPRDGDQSYRLTGAWAAVDGPGEVAMLALELGLRPFRVEGAARPAYHAAACVASNHLVALLGQVERLAAQIGVPAEAFAPLVRASVDNVFSIGAPGALTGPVARGDLATVGSHLDAIPEDERAAYRALAREAGRLAGRDDAELDAILEGPAGAASPTAAGGAGVSRRRPRVPAA